VEFDGRFNDMPFTLYDYKRDRRLRIGGTDGLDIESVTNNALRAWEFTAWARRIVWERARICCQRRRRK
jgi:hypothetical protein